MKSILFLIVLFISQISCFGQQSIDKVIAVVGEKQILYSEIQSQKLQMLVDFLEDYPPQMKLSSF